MTHRVAVAAPNAASAQAAVELGRQGGNAVDAAVAAMLVAMVNEPGMVSLGGGAFVTTWPSTQTEAVTIDGYVSMPGIGRPDRAAPPSLRDVQTEYGHGVRMTVGHGSVATPGALAALDEAHRRYGLLPWREVVHPAEVSAREGFTLGSASGYYLPFVRETVFAWDPETVATLRRPDGSWIEAGEHITVAGLAESLALIAAGGARALYEGPLAEALVDDMVDRGGLITTEDLLQYRAVVRPALPFVSGAWQLRTNPPPAIGGAVLATMLSMLGDAPRGKWTPDDVAHLVRVQRDVLDFRRLEIDSAADRVAPLEVLLARIGPGGERSPSTAHVSVVDTTGNACAITASSGYCSGVTVPGTGIWLNNCLGEHELNRGSPPPPGTRLASNMAPTVGRSFDGAVLAIGSPGADRITTALTQVLAAFTNGGATLQEAIDRPRLHVHHQTDRYGVVDLGVRIEAEEDMPLPELDLPVKRHHRQSMYFGGVAAAHLDAEGNIAAAGDPRRAGVVAVGPK